MAMRGAYVLLERFSALVGEPGDDPGQFRLPHGIAVAQTEGVRRAEFQIFTLQRIPRTGPIHNALRTLDLMPRAMWT